MKKILMKIICIPELIFLLLIFYSFGTQNKNLCLFSTIGFGFLIFFDVINR